MNEASTDFYRRIFENMFDIILVLSDAGEIEYGNYAAMKEYGYSYEELTGKTIFDIRKNDRREFVLNQIYVANSTGTEYGATHYRKDGSSFPVLVRPTICKDGIKNKAVNIIHNISDIRNVAEKTKGIDVSLDIAEEAVIVVDRDLHVTLWNKAAEERLGYKSKDLVGKAVEIIIPPEKREEWTAIQRRLEAGEVIEHIETERYHLKGHRIEVSVSYAPLYNSEAKIIGFIGIYSDISETRRRTRKLQEYHEKAALALEGGAFCIWEIDLSCNEMIVYNNMEALLGYTNGDIGTNYEDWIKLIHPEDYHMVYQQVIPKIKSNSDLVLECRMLSKTKEYRWVRAKGKVIKWNINHEPVRVVGTLEEITERKEIEREIIRKNKELEEMSVSAQKANDAKSLFLANMSHEIRTPLNGIISLVQLLQNTALDNEQKKLFRLLEGASATLMDIVTDILDISKIEQQRIELDQTEFSIRRMLNELFDELLIEASKKNIEAGYFFDQNINFDVIGDFQKVRKILRNLISNALKFTESGYISLKTYLVVQKNNQVTIDFEVKDSGIGIGYEFRDKIFNIFTQEDTSTEKKYSGTGLGLSISKRYARALGGDIIYDSVEGRGSIFHFTCPFEIVQVNRYPILSDPEINKTKLKYKSITKRNKMILSIDDNLVNQNVIEYMIEKADYQYVSAYNSEDAIRILEQKKIALILMDIQLPGMNGYELTKLIKQNVIWRKIPIIAMTAYSKVEDRGKCFAAGMDDFIVKPINIHLFMKSIDKLLKERR